MRIMCYHRLQITLLANKYQKLDEPKLFWRNVRELKTLTKGWRDQRRRRCDVTVTRFYTDVKMRLDRQRADVSHIRPLSLIPRACTGHLRTTIV